jgi:hypothetical protein
MKREKYLNLAKEADEICCMLMERKIDPNDGCIVRQIAEKQWNAMRASYNEINSVERDGPCGLSENNILSDHVRVDGIN